MSLETIKQVALGKICVKIGSGVTPRGGASVYVDNGTALIRSQNVHNSMFTTSGLAYISHSIAEKMKGVTVEENDVLLNITGDSVARSCRVPTDVLPARVNQHVAIIRTDKDRLDSSYLAHYLVSPRMQATMLSWSGSGGTRKALTKGMIEGFEIPLPPLKTQKRIATILSTYDKLIENNRRRIALLEDATQQLYKEWFVRFRYPNHNNVPIVDGVPDGWKLNALGDLAVINKGRYITKDTAEEGDIPVVAGGLKPAYYHSASNTEAPVITVSASGANAGYVAIYLEDIWASDCSYLSVRDNPDVWYWYATLKSRQTEITSMQQGAAQPHVYPKHLKRIKVIVPPARLVAEFSNFAKHNFLQVANLQLQIKQLTKARDILIPKLMNREITV